MGVRVSLAELGGAARPSPAANELDVEVFHYFWLTDWLALQPDAQFVRLPDPESSRNRLAFTLRLHLNR